MLSKGHANAALGAVLAQAGFVEDRFVDSFYAYESPFGMHPDIKVPGVEMCTGALGHGLSIGLGMALGARLREQDWRTVVMLGDGELQEGSNWEAAMAAAHLAPLRLTAVLDYNKVQQSGHVAEMLGLEPLADKWRAFGWSVRECDGHDMGAIVDALDALPAAPDRPSLLIAHNGQGQGRALRRGHLPLAQQRGERGGLREGARRAGRVGPNEPATAGQRRRACLGRGGGRPVAPRLRPRRDRAWQADERVVAVSADTLDLIGLRGFINTRPRASSTSASPSRTPWASPPASPPPACAPSSAATRPSSPHARWSRVRNEVAYADQRVVIGAAASGVSLAVSGGTHHALEDLALMRSLPNMTVIVPADAHEAWHATLATDAIEGPVYLRLGGRVPERAVMPTDGPFRLGRATRLADGADVTVIACGALVAPALDAAAALAIQGIGARVLNMSTIKPLDEEAILAAAEETRGIVTAEEHHLTGGLGRRRGGASRGPAADAHAHGRHARRIRVRGADRPHPCPLRHERAAHRGCLSRADGLKAPALRRLPRLPPRPSPG